MEHREGGSTWMAELQPVPRRLVLSPSGTWPKGNKTVALSSKGGVRPTSVVIMVN